MVASWGQAQGARAVGDGAQICDIRPAHGACPVCCPEETIADVQNSANGAELAAGNATRDCLPVHWILH